MLDYLGRYQYDLSTQAARRSTRACPEGRVLRASHVALRADYIAARRQYGLPLLLNRIAARLRRLASSDAARGGYGIPLIRAQCSNCKVKWEAEDKIIDSLVIKARQTREFERLPLSAICLLHLQELLKRADDTGVCKYLLLREAALLERTAEDMQRYWFRSSDSS